MLSNLDVEAQIRVAGPVEMTHLIRNAKKQGFNRQISDEVITQLADGYNFVIPMLIHEHKAGVQTDPHYRCRVLLRFADDPTLPHEAWLDVQINQFNELPTLEQIQQQIQKP